MRQKLAGLGPDAIVVGIAARQHGVVTIAQLLAAGLQPSGISRRVRAGRLHRIHRGVYAVGHRGLSREGDWMAGVLACGEGAVLSHLSAAALWGMLSRGAFPVHISTPRRSGRASRPGLALHRSTTLGPGQVTRRNAIPVTRPARTLEDVRRMLPASEFRKALRQAEYLRLAVGPQLEADGTRSELERKFLRLCRHHGIPAPEVNIRLGPFVVDFLWRTQGLVVETDGFRAHGSHSAFEADRERDAALRRLGFEVLRFSYAQVAERAARVAVTLRAALRLGEGAS